jgi:hypothetical protein
MVGAGDKVGGNDQVQIWRRGRKHLTYTRVLSAAGQTTVRVPLEEVGQ